MRTSTAARTAAACVLVDGPHPTTDREGDEVPEWTVCVGDEDGEPIGKVYRCHTRARAQTLGEQMSRDRRLELVDESERA